MNDNARKLIAALRSGEYKQTRGRLHDLNGFCCLGVACDIYQKNTQTDWYQDGDPFRCQGEKYVLPLAVRDFFGFLTLQGSFKPDLLYRQQYDPTMCSGRMVVANMAELNDQVEYSFEQIADYIEKEPQGLFKPEGTR